MWHNITKDQLLFVLIDMQEKFYPLIKEDDLHSCLKNIHLMIRMFDELHIPMIGTEHYVKGLGHTDSSILALWKGLPFTDKVTFSCWGDEVFKKNLRDQKRKTIVVSGLETHICVLQTVLDLVDNNYNVLVCADACVSSTKLKWENGLKLMEKAGALIVNTETLLFYLLQRVDRPEFKTMVQLLKQ